MKPGRKCNQELVVLNPIIVHNMVTQSSCINWVLNTSNALLKTLRLPWYLPYIWTFTFSHLPRHSRRWFIYGEGIWLGKSAIVGLSTIIYCMNGTSHNVKILNIELHMEKQLKSFNKSLNSKGCSNLGMTKDAIG